MADNDQKLTPEQIAAQFAPPSKESESPEAMASRFAAPAPTSDIKDLGLGTLQGLSFGLAPKAEAALSAGTEKLSGALTGQETRNYSDLYKQYQDMVQQKYNDAKKRSPWLYHGGEIVGSLASGLATGGLAPEAGIGARLAIAGGAGGASGFGQSQGDLTTSEGRSQALNDTLKGAAGGVVLGAAGEAIAPAIGKAVGAVTESPTVQKLGTAFKQGLEGKGFIGQEAEREIQQGIAQEAKSAAKTLVGARNKASAQIGQVLEESKAPLDAGDLLDHASDALKELAQTQKTVPLTRDFDRLSSAVEEFKTITSQANGATSPKELFNIRNQIRDIKSEITDPDVLKLSKQLLDSVDDKLKEVPGFVSAMSNLKEFSAAGPEVFLNKTVQQYGAKAESVLGANMEKIARKASGNAVSDVNSAARQKVQNFIDNLNLLKESKPSLLESLGIDNPQELISNLRKGTDLDAVRKQINQAGVEGFGSFANPLNWAGKVANLAKLGNYNPEAQLGSNLLKANQLGKAANVVTGLGHNLYHATPEVLQNVGSVLKQNGVALGDSLLNGIRSNNQGLKNAALFSILQRPDLRNMIMPKEKPDSEK